MLNFRQVLVGVVKLDTLASQILSGKLQPMDKVQSVISKNFKMVSIYKIYAHAQYNNLYICVVVLFYHSHITSDL